MFKWSRTLFIVSIAFQRDLHSTRSLAELGRKVSKVTWRRATPEVAFTRQPLLILITKLNIKNQTHDAQFLHDILPREPSLHNLFSVLKTNCLALTGYQ